MNIDNNITNFHSHKAEDAIGFPVDKLHPTRGLIVASNQNRVLYEIEALQKWIRMSKAVFKVDKIDFQFDDDSVSLWDAVLDFALSESLGISPRIPDTLSAAAMSHVLQSPITDVCLYADPAAPDELEHAIEKVKSFNYGIRVLLTGAFHSVNNIENFAQKIMQADAVHIAAYDALIPNAPRQWSVEDCVKSIQTMNALTKYLRSHNIDVSIIGLPFCQVDEENHPYALNRGQFFYDHQQYVLDSYVFAERIIRFKSSRLHKTTESKLSRRTSPLSGIDGALFPWIIDYPRLYVRTWILHKFLRHLRLPWRKPMPLPAVRPNYENELDNMLREKRKNFEKPCTGCCYLRICDYRTKQFRKHFAGIGVRPVEGELILTAPSQVCDHKRYYDQLDENRLDINDHIVDFAKATQNALLHDAPTREIVCDDYSIEGRYTHHMPGAVRWLSLSTGALESTILTKLEPPFILSYTLGGGFASHAGFSFGRQIKIVCPLIDYSHRITLGVNKNGHYVLLRDGIITRPNEFDNAKLLPSRLPAVLEPRICLYNIDGLIFTQTVLLWEGERQKTLKSDSVKYSVLIISTRFTRRLQAALLSILRQQDISPDLVEIIIGYVPGIDATDDLIDSLIYSYPKARILRSPFPETHIKSKGFMINESLKMASGKWVLLMDADIVIPPDTIARIDVVEDDHHMIAPEGRKMLPPDITAKILLNELHPDIEHDDLLQGPGEIRKGEAEGVPIGFFQCVRKEIFESIQYMELDHFEFSDWHFGKNVIDLYGAEYRIKDFYVFHLDHGGSQWYGTHKHR